MEFTENNKKAFGFLRDLRVSSVASVFLAVTGCELPVN